jgi:hypothetical protein
MPTRSRSCASPSPRPRAARRTSPASWTTEITDRLISIDGVADLQVYGDRSPIFRVDIDLMELASRGLTLADLRNTLADVAYDAPAGDLSGDRQSINVRTTAAVVSPEAFEDLVIRENVRVGDVARVSLGPAPNETILRANGETGLGLGVVRQATSNTLAISPGDGGGGGPAPLPPPGREHLRHLGRRRLHQRLHRGGAEDAAFCPSRSSSW